MKAEREGALYSAENKFGRDIYMNGVNNEAQGEYPGW